MSKSTAPRAHKTRSPNPPQARNPLPLATRRLAKRILQFHELPEPDRSRAFNTWLNSAGSPKRNDARQHRVREFYGLMEAIAKELNPRTRARLRAVGNAILAKAARKTPAAQRTPKRTPKGSKGYSWVRLISLSRASVDNLHTF